MYLFPHWLIILSFLGGQPGVYTYPFSNGIDCQAALFYLREYQPQTVAFCALPGRDL